MLLSAALLTVATVAAPGEAVRRSPAAALGATPTQTARAVKAPPTKRATKPPAKALTKQQQQDQAKGLALAAATAEDRKSTRLNSSHG